MANLLDNIMPKIVARGLMVLRERCIMARLAIADYGTEAKEYGDTIDVPVGVDIDTEDVVPSHNPKQPTDHSITKVPISLNKWRQNKPFYLTDKELYHVDKDKHFLPMAAFSSIKGLANYYNQQVMANYKHAYLVAGTAGTTPFASTTADIMEGRKQLNKFLAPKEDRVAIVDWDAEENLLKLATLTDAEKVGSSDVKIEGEIGRKFGFNWYGDDHVPSHTVNDTGAGALTVNGVHAIGATTLSIAKAAGANWSAKEGDLIYIASDDHRCYRIDADVTVTQGTNTDVTIEPGLKVATSGNEAITVIGVTATVGSTYINNLMFHKGAVAVANRPLIKSAIDGELGPKSFQMSDPKTGLSLRLEVTRQHKQTIWEFDILFGDALIRPENMVRLLG